MNMDSIDNEKTLIRGDKAGSYALAAGQMLGQFRVLRGLGRGGMGEVYLCEHAILTTRHAVKLLPAERSGSAGFVQRFHDEARVMAKLSHPGIVHVTHADEQSGRHYLVMDFVGADGTEEPFDLEDALAGAPENRLEPGTAARLCRRIAQAVGAAHRAGVVHRDLKPANVLLTSRDLEKADARVADFGLARLLGEDWLRSRIDTSIRQSMALRPDSGPQASIGEAPTMARRREERSSSGAILGTYEYMSPEQREGREADERSDVFALGVMLYRMTTGKRLVGRAKAASKIVAGLDPAWDELIDACLEEDPADRPQGMGELASALEKLEALERQRREADRKVQAEADAARRRREADEKKAREEAEARRQEEQRRAAAEAEAKRKAESARQAAAKPAPPKPQTQPKSSKAWVGVLVGLAVVGAVIWGLTRESGTAPKPSAATSTQTGFQPYSSPTSRGEPAAGSPRTVDLGGGVTLDLTWIPAGTFKMGSPAGEDGRFDGEGPQHDVTISPGFWMGRTEVTQRQYQQVMKNNPASFTASGLDAPVERVSWHNATDFCARVQTRLAGDLAGKTVRLPTEAEWEYACRAETTGPFYFGSCLSTDQANYDGNYPLKGCSKGQYRQKTVPVGTLGKNKWGLYDMHGNVWEWCWDGPRAYTTAPQTNPTGTGSARVLRGGSWDYDARFCRSARRNYNVPGNTDFIIGFRVIVR